jgi:hypothetical protein
MLIRKVWLSPIEGEETLFEARMPAKSFNEQESILSPGLHMDVRSYHEHRLTTTVEIFRLKKENN